MANIGTLTAKIGADYSGLDRGLSKAKQSLDNFANTAFKAVGIAAAAMSAVVVYELGKIGKASLETAKSFEAMGIKLDALTKGKGVETLEAINKWALDMPVNTEKAVQSFTTMMAMGLDPTLEKMQTLVDTSVLFGEEALPRVSRALGQMAALGKLSAEELNQLSEVGINARKYLTEAFGLTVEELQKTSVTIEEIIDVIWSGLAEEFGGAAEKAMDTWAGLNTTIESYGTELKRLVMASGPMEAFKMILKEIVDNLEAWMKSGDMVSFAQETGQAIVSIIANVVEAIGWMPTAFYSVKEAVNTVISYVAAMGEKAIEVAMIAEMIQKPWKLLQFSMESIKEENKSLDDILSKLFPKLATLKSSISDVGVSQAEAALSASASAQKFAEWGLRAEELATQIRNIKVDLSGLGDVDPEKVLGEGVKKLTDDVIKLREELEAIAGIDFDIEIGIEATGDIPKQVEEIPSGVYDLLGEWAKIINEAGYDFGELVKLSGQSFSASSASASVALGAAYAEMILQTIQTIEHIIKLPQEIVDATSSLLDTIGNFGTNLTDSLNNLVDSLYNAVIGLGDIFEKLIPKLATITQELTLAFIRAIPELIKSIVDSIPEIINAFIYEIPKITAEIISEIPKIVEALVSSIPDMATATVSGISSSISSLWDDVSGFFEDAWDSIFGSDDKVREYLTGIAQISLDGLFDVTLIEEWSDEISSSAEQAANEALLELVETTLESYQDLFLSLSTELQNYISQQIDSFTLGYDISSAQGKLWEYWEDEMEDIPGEIADILDPIFQEAIDAYVSTFYDLLDIKSIAQFGEVIDLSAFWTAIDVIQDFIDNVAEATAEEMVEVLEAVEEIQGMWADIIAPVESLIEDITGYQTEMSRRDWGVAEYSQYYADLVEELSGLNSTTETYYQDSLDIMTELVDVAMEIEAIQEQQLAALEDSLSSVTDMINELTGGELAPVESFEFYQGQYESLLAAIIAAQGTEDINAAVSEFLSFIPDYLDFMSAYGVDYAELTAQVISDLQSIQGVLQADIDILSSGLDEIALNTGETVSGLNYISEQLTNFQSWLEEMVPTSDQVMEAIEEAGGIVSETTPTVEIDLSGIDLSGISGILDSFTNIGSFQRGGLTDGPALAGEIGPEWIVPTYEPERSGFLSTIGLDPDSLGRAISKHLNGGSTGAENINLNVYLEGKHIRAVVTEGLKSRDTELINAVRKATRINRPMMRGR